EPLLDVVERRPVQVEVALLVAHDLDAVDVELAVVRPELRVELEQIRQAGAAAALHAHPEEHGLRKVLDLLQLLDLMDRRFRQFQRHGSECLLDKTLTKWWPPTCRPRQRRPPHPTSPCSPTAPP